MERTLQVKNTKTGRIMPMTTSAYNTLRGGKRGAHYTVLGPVAEATAEPAATSNRLPTTPTTPAANLTPAPVTTPAVETVAPTPAAVMEPAPVAVASVDAPADVTPDAYDSMATLGLRNLAIERGMDVGNLSDEDRRGQYLAYLRK